MSTHILLTDETGCSLVAWCFPAVHRGLRLIASMGGKSYWVHPCMHMASRIKGKVNTIVIEKELVRFMEDYRSQLQMRIWSSAMNCLDEHSPSQCYQGWVWFCLICSYTILSLLPDEIVTL